MNVELLIEHTTRYAYQRPVQLAPMTVRLRPRENGRRNLLEHRMEILPEPEGRSEGVDLFGNAVHLLWFASDFHRELSVRILSKVHAPPFNPFEYVVTDPSVLQLPARYERQTEALRPYLNRIQSHPAVDGVAAWHREKSSNQTHRFLQDLNTHLATNFQYVVRPDGAPKPPADTLAEGAGSCRDLAVLMMDLCRAVGLASRFVSGYCYQGPEIFHHHLHAWVEVFLPGAGWRGYDPSAGLVTAETYVPVAAGPAAADAAPMEGRFGASGYVDSTLETSVNVELAETSSPQPTAEG